MTQVTALQSADTSRLLRCLNELGVLDVPASRLPFAAQLASHIDFSASIKLATALGNMDAETFPPGEAREETPREIFLRLRSAIVGSLLDSFATKPARSHLKLPALEEPSPGDAGAAYAPYLRFYHGQQRMLEAKVQNLHLQVRDAAAMLSPRLAQLCFLDAALGDTLAAHARNAFSYTPRLLELRFRKLLEQYRQQAIGDGSALTPWARWQQQFQRELRDMLLAELEARLLPTLGLVEAIDPIKATNENREPASL
jgi:hypothetical protein